MTDLSRPMRQVLATLSDTIEPLSGRRLASLTRMSPTTTNKALAALSELEAVSSTRRGRAVFWQTTRAAERILAGPDGRRVDRSALVLTALPLEYVAIRDRLVDDDELRAPNGVRYLESTVSGLHVRWTVYVVEIGMGNTAAASLIGYAIDRCDVDLVMFVGVAGGLKPDDQHHGDVVIANHVYNAHSGKYGAAADGRPTFQSRPISRHTTHELEQLAQQLARMPERISAGEQRRKPKITVGPIASIEAVVANKDSQLYRRIRDGLNNCVAVDMESFGTYEAAYRTDVPAIAVRGISDFVEDKNAGSDIEWQPIAARNAAHVAVDLLVHAHPDDVPSRRFSPTIPPEPDDESARALPPHAQPWEARLRATLPKLADAALKELTSSSATPLASWVSRTLNRPTAWLRADTTGDGWALVGALAEAIGASTASRAYERAARLAQDGGQLALAATHRLRAALSIRVPGDDATRTSAIRDALEALDLSDCPQLRPLAEFHIATTHLASTQVLEAATSALVSLGHDPALVGLDAAHRTADDNKADENKNVPPRPSVPVAIAPLPDEIRTVLAASVLLTVSVAHLLTENGESAQRAAEAALALAPDSTTAQLRRDQAILTRLHTQSTPSALEDTSDLLRRVEHSALAVRRTRQQWGGSTAEALALAGRTRIEAGDAAGALRLLQAAPHGQATDDEAQSDNVRQVATMAALISGDNELALQLASTLNNNIETHLMRAAAFAQSSGMRGEARASYLRALELAEGNAHYLERTLLGLVRLGEPFEGPGANTLTKQLQQLRNHNPQAADLVLGTAALSAGDYDRALDLARRHRTVLRAVELETDALMASGKAAEGVERLDSFGRNRGDNTLRIQAMMLAGQAGLYETVDRIADAVIGACDGEPRRLAREAKTEAATRTQAWDAVDLQARLLLEELDNADPTLAAEHMVKYRWIRAEALYHRRRFGVALEVVSQPAPPPVTQREQVLLVLAIARALAFESPGDLPDTVFDWILTISAVWVKDEQIGVEALNLIVTLPATYTDERLMRARALLENYFTFHEDKAQIERIEFSPDPTNPDNLDLTPLIDRLRSQFEPRAEALSELVTKLWLGRLPAGFLADITHRSYAEALIKQKLGCYVIREDPSPHAAQNAAKRGRAARDALRSGRVVVDTGALIIGNKLGVPRAHLTGLFHQVILPVSLRDDVYNARASLALRSDMTMGWDPVTNRPTITRYDKDTVRGWAEDADALQRDLAQLSIQPDVRDADRAIWNAALLLAKESETPLWADDVALHAVASHEGVPVFGTLDLLDAAHDENRIEAPLPEDLHAALVTARAVDLPLDKPWAVCAEDDDWDPSGYTALRISRPAAWANQAASFEQYRNLIRTLIARSPNPNSAEYITGWAAAAVNGIAWATPPAGRPKVVGILLAWTALNTEPMLDAVTISNSANFRGERTDEEAPEHAGKILSALLAIAVSVRNSAFPTGDGIHHVVVTIADTIRTVSDGVTTAAILSRALSKLDDELRARAMTAFLSSPAIAIPNRDASDK